MDLSHSGYFVAVCIIVFGSVAGWLVRMLFAEKSIRERLTYLKTESGEEISGDG